MPFVIPHYTITRICEPNSAIWMYNDIIGRIQKLAVPVIRQNSHNTVMFTSDHSPRVVLAGKQPSFKVECVPVGIVRGLVARAYVAVLFQSPHNAIVGNVTP